MLIYEILLNDEETITLNKLDRYNVEHHGTHLSVPKLKPLKHIYPDDEDELLEITKEISKADDIKVRGKGW